MRTNKFGLQLKEYLDFNNISNVDFADKIGAQYTLVLGDNEIQIGSAALKNMETGEQTDVNLDNLYEYLK